MTTYCYINVKRRKQNKEFKKETEMFKVKNVKQ